MAEVASFAFARSEFVLGGQKSGKSRRAEMLARAWCDRSDAHRAVLIATAQAHDDEMRARILRHREQRALRVPRMRTVEEPVDLAGAIALHNEPGTLIVVDCLTLWLTNLMMPPPGTVPCGTMGVQARAAELLGAVAHAPGPLVLVGNEIGLGVIPLGPEVRAFVDTLGWLNQRVAQACTRAVLMAAGLPLVLKDDMKARA